MADVDGILEISESCDTLALIVAEVVYRTHPELDRMAVAEVASVELFSACQDVARLFLLDVDDMPPPDDALRESVARMLARWDEIKDEAEGDDDDCC